MSKDLKCLLFGKGKYALIHQGTFSRSKTVKGVDLRDQGNYLNVVPYLIVSGIKFDAKAGTKTDQAYIVSKFGHSIGELVKQQGKSVNWLVRDLRISTESGLVFRKQEKSVLRRCYSSEFAAESVLKRYSPRCVFSFAGNTMRRKFGLQKISMSFTTEAEDMVHEMTIVETVLSRILVKELSLIHDSLKVFDDSHKVTTISKFSAIHE